MKAVAGWVLPNPDDAQEVASSCCVTLLEKAHLYDSSRGGPDAWLKRMVINRAIERLRLRKWLPLPPPESAPPGGPDPADEVERAEEIARCLRALEELPAPLRAAVSGRYLKGWGYERLARELGCSLATAHGRVRRGLTALAGRLAA
jgi:RNA polymerase sigma-70 factor (ECF subfamily)